MLSIEPKLRTVLLDNGIFSHSEFAEGAVQQEHLSWGGTDQTVSVHGIRKKSPNSNPELQVQINALPTVGRLIQEGELEAYEYREIWCERMRYRPLLPFGNALRNCEIVTCNAPVERAKFVGTTDFSQYLAKGGKKDRRAGMAWNAASQISFLNLLCRLEHESVEALVQAAKRFRLTDFEVENLRNLHWFQLLCERCGGPEHYPDVFHLWTAECNGLHVFLTLERRFPEFISRVKDEGEIEIRTQVMRPLELLRRLGIKRPDPVPLENDRFYHLHELD